MTVRYENIHLHAKVGQAASAQFRQWLDQNNIAYTNLDYADPLDDLRAFLLGTTTITETSLSSLTHQC